MSLPYHIDQPTMYSGTWQTSLTRYLTMKINMNLISSYSKYTIPPFLLNEDPCNHVLWNSSRIFIQDNNDLFFCAHVRLDYFRSDSYVKRDAIWNYVIFTNYRPVLKHYMKIFLILIILVERSIWLPYLKIVLLSVSIHSIWHVAPK